MILWCMVQKKIKQWTGQVNAGTTHPSSPLPGHRPPSMESQQPLASPNDPSPLHKYWEVQSLFPHLKMKMRMRVNMGNCSVIVLIRTVPLWKQKEHLSRITLQVHEAEAERWGWVKRNQQSKQAVARQPGPSHSHNFRDESYFQRWGPPHS